MNDIVNLEEQLTQYKEEATEDTAIELAKTLLALKLFIPEHIAEITSLPLRKINKLKKLYLTKDEENNIYQKYKRYIFNNIISFNNFSEAYTENYIQNFKNEYNITELNEEEYDRLSKVAHDKALERFESL